MPLRCRYSEQGPTPLSTPTALCGLGAGSARARRGLGVGSAQARRGRGAARRGVWARRRLVRERGAVGLPSQRGAATLPARHSGARRDWAQREVRRDWAQREARRDAAKQSAEQRSAHRASVKQLHVLCVFCVGHVWCAVDVCLMIWVLS